MNPFEGVLPFTLSILSQLKPGSNIVSFGGEHAQDIQSIAVPIIEKGFQVRTYEKFPDQCFQCSNNNRSPKDYESLMKEKMRGFGIPEEQIHIYPGSDIGECFNHISDDVDTYFILDTRNLVELQMFKSRARKLYPNGLINCLLLTNISHRHPGCDLRMAELLLGDVKVIGEYRYPSRGIGQPRKLSLFVREDSPWEIDE